jgi:hypothetical protein
VTLGGPSRLTLLSLETSARVCGASIGDYDRDGFADVVRLTSLVFGGSAPFTRVLSVVGADGVPHLSGNVGVFGDANGDEADDFATHATDAAILLVYLSSVSGSPLRPTATLPVIAHDGTFSVRFAQ